jgi:hypothetical protein
MLAWLRATIQYLTGARRFAAGALALYLISGPNAYPPPS